MRSSVARRHGGTGKPYIPDTFIAGFDYPIFVVTAHDPATGSRAGCLVGFATQTSIDPFRYLVCLSRNNHTFSVAENSTFLAVHALDRNDPVQQDLAELFGTRTGDDIDKFAQYAWNPGPEGLPLLAAASRHLIGRILDRFPFGDHVGFLLTPVQVNVTGNDQLLSFHDVESLEPGHAAG